MGRQYAETTSSCHSVAPNGRPSLQALYAGRSAHVPTRRRWVKKPLGVRRLAPVSSNVPELGITVDCTDATAVAAFWCRALGYLEAPPPIGWSDWPSFLRDHDVPEDEWGDGASIVPAAGDGPRISFLKVPEPKAVKNRIHLDVKVSGGRHIDQALRERRIREKVAELVEHGATVAREDFLQECLDHVVLLDPEGNEFCVV